MLARICAAAGTALVLLGAASANAHADDGDQGWVMVDLSGMTLKEATDAVREITGNPETKVDAMDVRGPKNQHIVLKNWDVCWQAPKPDKTFDDSTWIGVGVVRHGVKCY